MNPEPTPLVIRSPLLRLLSWCFSWRGVRTLAFLFVSLLTLIALGVGFWNWRSESAWRRYRADGEARGVKFDLRQLVPPSVPEAQNYAALPALAPLFEVPPPPARDRMMRGEAGMLRFTANSRKAGAGKEPPSGRWRLGQMTDLVAWQDYYSVSSEFHHPDKPGRPGADVLTALDESREMLAELRTGLTRPECRFDVRYENENAAAILLPHVSVIKRMTLFLQLYAVAQLSENHPNEAAEAMDIALKLDTGLAREPILISYLVRAANLKGILQTIWEGASLGRWTPAQLEHFQEELQKRDFVAALQAAVRGERTFGNAMYDRWVASPKNLRNDGDLFSESGGPRGGPTGLFAAAGLFFPRAILRENQITQNRFCDLMDVQLAAIQPTPGNYAPIDLSRIERDQEAAINPPSYRNVIVRMLQPALVKLVSSGQMAQSCRDLAMTGLAVERFHQANGSYPATLEALSPRFLQVIPKDIFSGQPLRYRVEKTGGFVLYSVGPNEQDDGGDWPARELDPKQRPTRNEKDDIVWRYARPE
jgi:hypothetical protein